MNSYTIGAVYFDLKYAERDMLFPIIDTVIAVGENLLPDDESVIYFQPVDSYIHHGPVTTSSSGNRGVLAIKSEVAHRRILDIEGLIRELNDAESRRASTGHQ